MTGDGVASVATVVLGFGRPGVLCGACCRLVATLRQGRCPRAWAEGEVFPFLVTVADSERPCSLLGGGWP
jgi:hypothetical protein